VNPHALERDDLADERAFQIDGLRGGVPVDSSALFEGDVVRGGQDFSLYVARNRDGLLRLDRAGHDDPFADGVHVDEVAPVYAPGRDD